MRFSAGKRDVFPALRSTGSLPVFWTWNSPRGRKAHSFGGVVDYHAARGCSGIAFAPNSLLFANLAMRFAHDSGDDVTFYDTSAWNPTSGISTQPLVPPSEGCSTYLAPTASGIVAISNDSQFLAVSGTNSRVCKGQGGIINTSAIAVFDIKKGTLLTIIPDDASSLDWSPDGIHLAAAGIGDIKIYDFHSGVAVTTESVESSRPRIRYSRNGKYLIEAVGKKLEIWDGSHQRLLQVFTGEVPNIAVSADGRYLALGGGDNNILDATAMSSLIFHPNGTGGKVIVYKLK
jgi:WD40 repeat protein